MRVTLVISALTAGGAERVMSIMANHWAAKGWEVTLITADDGRAEPFYALSSGVRHLALGVLEKSKTPLHSVRNNLRYVLRLRRAIRMSKADAVISFITECNIRTLLATAGLKIPVVVSERNDPSRYKIGKVWQILRRRLYSRARRVVAQTQEAKEFFPPLLQERISVIPNPVLPSDTGAPERLPANPPTIISVGRLVTQKGFDVLIEAFARIAEKHPEWQLKIIGEGPLRGRLEEQARRLGIGERLMLPGSSKELAREMSAAELFVSSSRWEGFPNALCEAMACGLPVVATNCSAGPREIVHDGTNGYLVPADDAGALSIAIDRLMGDAALRQRLGASAVEVTSRYGVDRIMERWEAVLFRQSGELL